jgi:hypothetical protein
VDFTDPVGRLSSAIPLPEIQLGLEEYRETVGQSYGSEKYRVYERKGETAKVDDVKYTTSYAYWKDVAGVISRYVTTVQIHTGNDVVTLISVADRVATVALPNWYGVETIRAHRNAVPAAAAMRAMMRTRQNVRAPVDQLTYFGSHRSDNQPILSPPFSVSGSFTAVVDVLIPSAHADGWGWLDDQIQGKIDGLLPQPGEGLVDRAFDRVLAGGSIDKDFVLNEFKIWVQGEGEDLLKKALEAGLVRLYPPFAFYGLGGLVADFVVAGVIDAIKALVHGDPHLSTFDNHRYDFQAVGEFVQVETPTFMVQHRFAGNKGRVTSTQATAIRAGDHIVEFYWSSDSDSLSAIVDGAVVEVDYDGISFDDGTFIARRDTQGSWTVKTKLIVVDPSGSYALIENFLRAQNVSISLTDDMKSQVSGGLGGIPDGNTANDFTLRDGTVMDLDESKTIEGLYGRFATSWRVRPEERLFTQGNAEDYLTAKYTDIPGTITRISDFSQAEIDRARKTCTDAGVSAEPAFEDCTYDVLVTDDPAWAQMAASSAVVLASVQPAPATPGDEPRAEMLPESGPTTVAITARKPDGSSPLENMQWTIINQSTEEMLIPESESGEISVELTPGRYDVLVASDGYEGETTIEVEPGSNQYVVDLQARGVADSFSSPDTVPAGEIMSFEWKGPAGEKDRIFIAPLNMAENRYKTSNVHSASGGSPAVLIAPALPGAYEIRYYSGANGSVAFRKALEVTAAEVRISAPGELIAGTEFTFDWEGPNLNGDRLFLAKPEMDASRYYTGSDVSHMATAGPSANLIAPVKAGDYEIRYYSSANGLPLVRYPIRVTPHAVKIDAPRTVAPGAVFEFSWEGPNANGDFLFVAEPEMGGNRYYIGSGHSTKDGPSGKFTAPTDPGAYEIRYFSKRNGAMLAKRVFMVR